ncbi:hypothetical protein ACQCN2_04275 [Brevibacillus ginsengisoli]|uniref:hypothetical protein n=1 Tax=Brevibacillus ginsengisoli TaxID=363854 RepID=UPI003CF15F69
MMPRQLLAVLCLATCLAFALSLIPSIAVQSPYKELPVFQEIRQVDLTQQNIVDLFTLMPTHYNIKRIKWENRSIFVDFVITPTETIGLSTFYGDVYNIMYRTFRMTTNIDHLFVRLLDEGDQSSKLLIAITGNRPGSIRDLPSPDNVDNPQYLVEKTFQVRVEPITEERISP